MRLPLVVLREYQLGWGESSMGATMPRSSRSIQKASFLW